MPQTPITPQRAEQIRHLLAELRVQPLDPGYTPAAAAASGQRYFMTPVVDRRQRSVWLKATLHDTPWLRRSLREEIRVQRAFAAYEAKYHPRFDSPSYIASGDNRRGFIWLVRKYWTGIFAGDMTDRFGMSFVFLRRVSPVTMAAIYHDVRAMTSFVKRRIDPGVHDYRWYALDLAYYQKTFFRPLLRSPLDAGWNKDTVDRLEATLAQYRSFFGQHGTTFTHGDMYPNNIMFRPGARHPVVLFDWELSHLNLPTFDPVMVYLQAWRSPRWQAAFKQQTLRLLGQPRVMTTAWNLAQVSLATRLAAFCFIRLTNSQPERYPPIRPAERRVILPLFRKNMGHLEAALRQLRPT